MAIAGLLVCPAPPADQAQLVARIAGLDTVDVKGVGPRGIAVVVEAADNSQIEVLVRHLRHWPEVDDVQLAYANWEEP